MRLGIDLGGTKTAGIVMDDQGKTLAKERRPTPADAGYDAMVQSIVDMVNALERQAGATCTVGLGTPGAISRRTHAMKNCNTTCLNGRPLREDLQARLGRPIRISNDANCFTLSEARDGAAAGHNVVFGVILGTGVGGGIVLGGAVHEGPNGIAGEWGHSLLDASGPLCYCGRHGCVETWLCGPALAAQYRAAGGVVTDAERRDATVVVARAEAGEACAQGVLAAYLQYFGRALANVIDILDPDVVVLGGGLSNMPILYDAGVQAVAHYIFNDELRTPILRHVHGDDSGVRGAAWLW